MNLCCDCAHVLPSALGKIDENARCAMFKGPVHPVTGAQSQAYAQNCRENPQACSMTALKFTPREQVAA